LAGFQRQCDDGGPSCLVNPDFVNGIGGIQIPQLFGSGLQRLFGFFVEGMHQHVAFSQREVGSKRRQRCLRRAAAGDGDVDSGDDGRLTRIDLHPQPIFVRFGGFDLYDGLGGIIPEGFKSRRYFPFGLTGKPLQPEPVRFSVLHQAGRQGQRLQNIFSRVSVNAFHDDFYRVGCRSDGNKPGSGKQAEKKESAAKCSHGWRRCRGCRIGKGHDPDRFF